MKAGASRTRFGLTFAVALAAIAAFAAMGGTGLASGLAKPAKKQYGPGQYQYRSASTKKVTICHNEKLTLSISVNAMPAHIRLHGDTVGACATSASATAKGAAAAAAAKAKAAKAKAAKAAAKAKKATDEASATGGRPPPRRGASTGSGWRASPGSPAPAPGGRRRSRRGPP